MKTKFSRKEKWLLISTTTLSLSFLVLNGIYQWNNRVPDVVIPETPMPKDNALHYYQRATKLYVAPPSPSPRLAVDIDFDTNTPRVIPELYSKKYDKLYPLARKQVFLKRNAKAIALWREGLKRHYVQPPEREAKTVVELGPFRTLARGIVVEAHAKAQSGDWDGAADSLFDIIHFGYEVPRGGVLVPGLVGIAIREIGIKQVWDILPHLSMAKKQDVVRKLERLHQSRVTMAESFEEEKRSMQRVILKMTREREFRHLFVAYGCGLPCSISEQQYQEDLDNLPRLLQMKLAWMNKPHIFNEYSRCMDWQIEQMKKPYSKQSKEWPFPESSDDKDMNWFIYQEFKRAPMNAHRIDTKESLLITMLALDVYHAEKGKYPQSLNALVPRYLKKVPLDPYSNNQPLRYKPKPLRYLSSLRYKEKSESGEALSQQAPSGGPPPASSEYSVSARAENVRTYKTVPYTLYSIGLDSRDDSGKPYQDDKYKNDVNQVADRARYSLRNYYDTEKCDVVAGINW